jgi:Protein of unknown function (DUF1091)
MGAKIYFHSVELIANPFFTSDPMVMAFNDSEGISKVNMSISLNKDLQTLKSLVVLKVKLGEDRSYDKEILQTTIDSCKIDKGAFSNFIVKFVMENLRNHTNYSFKCPQLKAQLYGTNINVDGIVRYIPRQFMMLAGKLQIRWKFTASGKTRTSTKSKNLVEVFKVTFVGSLVEDD